MNIPNIDIRHGRFIDIESPPQTFDGITFAAARVELLGTSFDCVCKLEEHLSRTAVTADIRTLIRLGEDAAWVRGRAQRLFFIPNTTEDERPEKSFFCGSFLALLKDDSGSHYGVPFNCIDHYGRTGLMFSSEDAPPEPLQQRIAAAFWSLLLSDPTDLDDYRDAMFHSGAGITIVFGVENGEPFVEERE